MISTRDYFAGQVLNALMQSARDLGTVTKEQRLKSIWPSVRDICYEAADFMLEDPVWVSE